MQKFTAFFVTFLCQLVPSIALAWSLGSKDIGHVTSASVPAAVVPSDVIFGGIFGGLLPSIAFGILVVKFAPQIFTYAIRSSVIIVLSYIIFSAISINWVAKFFEDSYGATWMPGEAFFELGMGSSITIPAYFFGLLIALISLIIVYKRNIISQEYSK